MNLVETLTERNATFARTRFSPALKIIPSKKTLIIGCVDPRVDPADLFGLEPGEAAILRNVGGRVTPATFETMEMLGLVAKAGGGAFGPGWNLVVLHHTDCGITRLANEPALLQRYFGVEPSALDGLAITDPRVSVAVDVAALRASPRTPGGFVVSGLVYDVATGTVETVVPPAPLRGE